jgi:hypothetical protein
VLTSPTRETTPKEVGMMGITTKMVARVIIGYGRKCKGTKE